MKPLKDTDVVKGPEFEARVVKRLADGGYLENRGNVFLVGKHGTGKTHAVLALGIEACRQGHRVKLTTAAALVNQLVEARDDRQLKNVMCKLRGFRILVLDELGYNPLSREVRQGKPVLPFMVGPLSTIAMGYFSAAIYKEYKS